MCAFVLSHFSGVRLFVTLWTVAHQAPLSMKFSRKEYWSGLPFPSPGNLPDPGTDPMSPAIPALQADSLPLCHWGSPARDGARNKEKNKQMHLISPKLQARALLSHLRK